MWKLDKSGIILLISVLSGCVILYTTSGGLIGIILALIIIGYACVSLLIDQSLVTRYALFLSDYLTQNTINCYKFIECLTRQTSNYINQLFEVIKTLYKEQITNRMERYRRNTYQLSSDSLVNNPRASGELKSIKGLSPIAKRSINAHISESENSIYGRGNSGAYVNGRAVDKVTSTPMTSWKNREPLNGDISGDSLMTHRRLKKSSSELSPGLDRSRNNDTVYSGQDGSPWGTTISPKIRPRAAGVKTVQTVAGPLLASTRYNIDTKTYSDVTSPGLTSRLTKYATEANTKLMHHSQYGTGQFPKVNLNSSPTPLINSKTGKMRLPVTVRIAPADSRYSPPDRQRIMSDICQKEIIKTPPTVAQVLRDISLKRHASREDVAAELIKKQRTDGIYGDELENLEEMTQKRTRDESSRSDEDTSIDNTSLRPVKRTKKPSCYDIINSLSSSTNVNSGVKRKADISRSGTPDIGKHFKSLDNSHAVSGASKMSPDGQKINRSINESNCSMTDAHSQKYSPASVSPKTSVRSMMKQTSPEAHEIEEIFKDTKNSMPDVVPVKLTDRLFMREEPQNIDKLKTLIDEHSSLSSKFSRSDVEEIKKSDIVNMRQTSMKAKLKSMFDAISGKTSTTIDPSVVIQAEPITPTPSSPPSLATLSSTTSTTNVNTSPISTSAIVPIIGKSKAQGTPGKHVTFNLSSALSSTSSSVANGDEKIEEIKKPESSTALAVPSFSFGSNTMTSSSGGKPQTLGFSMTPETTSSAPSLFSVPQSTVASTPALIIPPNTIASGPNPSADQVSTAPIQTSNIQNQGFSFGSSTTSASSTSQTIPTFSQSTQKSLFQPEKTVSTPANPDLFGTAPKATTLFNTSTSTTPASSSSSASSSVCPPLDPANYHLMFPGSNKSSNPPKLTGFNFGATSTGAAPSNQVATTTASTTSTGTGFSFGGNTPIFSATPTTTATPTQSTGFTFGGNKTTVSATTQSGFSFGTSSTAPIISFGASTTSQAPTATSTLTFATAASSAPAFGNPSTAPPAFRTPTATASAPAFTIPSTAPSAFSTPSATVPAPAFGTPSTSAPPAFGTPSTSAPPAFGTPSTSAPPAFGTPSTSTPPAFGTPSTSAPPAFGAPTTSAPPAFGAPLAASLTPVFGTQSAPAFGSTSSSLFGTPSSQSSFNPTPTTSSAITFGPPKTTAAPAFGTTTSSSTSLFNGTSTPAATSAPGASSMFSGASAFGQAKPPPAFGATTTANTGFGSSSSLFGGQPTTTAGFGVNSSTTTSTFGTASSSAPAFGGSTTNAAPAFGTSSTVPSFGGTSSGFGAQNGSSAGFSTATPTFGATTTAPPAFPTGTSSTSGFGTPSTAPPAFASTNSSFSGFGGGNTSSSAVVPFGGQQQVSTTAFGSSSSTAPAFGAGNGNNGATFAFGGNPSTSATTQGTQQNSMFAFGGGNANSGFPFSGATAPQTGGFNFSGSATPSSAGVPSFSAPSPAFGSSSGGNMFSIGSGSVAPRSRPTRQGRRQR